MTAERIDYVTFVRRGDEDMLYNQQLPQWENAVHAANEEQAAARTWASIKPAMKGGYTVFNAWGENVNLLINALPREWVSSMSRCDFRREYDGMSDTMWQGAMASMQATAPKSLTTTYIRSRPVTKSDRRDVGGHGFRYGSRKSDRSLIYYKRGSDKPCIEFRLQGKACLKMARSLLELYPENHHLNIAQALQLQMWAEQAAWFHHTLKTNEVQHMGAMLGIGDKVLAAYEQAALFVETLEEKEFWENRSTEEQEDMQQATWDVTPKGAKAMTRNQYKRLDEVGEPYPMSDDEIPF